MARGRPFIRCDRDRARHRAAEPDGSVSDREGELGVAHGREQPGGERPRRDRRGRRHPVVPQRYRQRHRGHLHLPAARGRRGVRDGDQDRHAHDPRRDREARRRAEALRGRDHRGSRRRPARRGAPGRVHADDLGDPGARHGRRRAALRRGRGVPRRHVAARAPHGGRAALRARRRARPADDRRRRQARHRSRAGRVARDPEQRAGRGWPDQGHAGVRRQGRRSVVPDPHARGDLVHRSRRAITTPIIRWKSRAPAEGWSEQDGNDALRGGDRPKAPPLAKAAQAARSIALAGHARSQRDDGAATRTRSAASARRARWSMRSRHGDSVAIAGGASIAARRRRPTPRAPTSSGRGRRRLRRSI